MMLLEEIPAIFSYKELAQILDVSVSHARNIANGAGFPVHHLSPKVHRIYKASFLRWMESQSGISAEEIYK